MQDHSDEYYSRERPELLELILSTGGIQSVLDIGCGFGYVGRALKGRGAGLVEGVELNPRAASEAMHDLDRVLVGSIEDENLMESLSRYDCIICGDILEHLVDPWATLTHLRSHLRQDGRIVASLPNIRYFKVMYDLVFRGIWEYRAEGILDQGHLRFFTKKEITKMFSQAGYKISLMQNNYSASKYNAVFNKLTFGLFKELFTFQFLLVAKAVAQSKD